MLKLYDYWRSSAAYRTRIGFNLKSVSYESAPIDIRPDRGEQFESAYLAKNPQARVPALESERGVVNQSLAILEWLDETYPDPPFLPGDAWKRAQIRAFALTIACDIHPVSMLSVAGRIRAKFAADELGISDWIAHWIRLGFTNLEALLARSPETAFAFGERPTLAEICLVPQMYNARRYGVELGGFPRLEAIDARARDLAPFAAAAPERQKDAVGAP